MVFPQPSNSSTNFLISFFPVWVTDMCGLAIKRVANAHEVSTWAFSFVNHSMVSCFLFWQSVLCFLVFTLSFLNKTIADCSEFSFTFFCCKKLIFTTPFDRSFYIFFPSVLGATYISPIFCLLLDCICLNENFRPARDKVAPLTLDLFCCEKGLI